MTLEEHPAYKLGRMLHNFSTSLWSRDPGYLGDLLDIEPNNWKLLTNGVYVSIYLSKSDLIHIKEVAVGYGRSFMLEGLDELYEQALVAPPVTLQDLINHYPVKGLKIVVNFGDMEMSRYVGSNGMPYIMDYLNPKKPVDIKEETRKIEV